MDYKKRLTLVATIVVVSVVLDQVTKRMAIAWLMGEPPIVYLGDFFRLQYAENTGAFLGIFGQMSALVRKLLLIGFNTVILVAVSYYLLRPTDVSKMMTTAFALILSGGIGNLIDRVAYNGIVVDFMTMGLPFIQIRGWEPRTGIFNVADLAIVGGLLLVIAAEFLKPTPGDGASPETPPE
jgi:signal peptidase II